MRDHVGCQGGTVMMRFVDGGVVPFLNPPAGETFLRDPQAQYREAIERPGFIKELGAGGGRGGGTAGSRAVRNMSPAAAPDAMIREGLDMINRQRALKADISRGRANQLEQKLSETKNFAEQRSLQNQIKGQRSRASRFSPAPPDLP